MLLGGACSLSEAYGEEDLLLGNSGFSMRKCVAGCSIKGRSEVSYSWSFNSIRLVISIYSTLCLDWLAVGSFGIPGG
jgi:hypothetical protein